MNCREIVELLCEFLEGELSEEQCRHIQQHLDTCPPCVVYIKTYQVTIRLGRTLPREPIPRSLEEKLQEMLKQVQREE
jgi:hypothetical protein